MKTALVLSAGGMFGAYQAGVWSVLADCLEPDLVVGASAGAMNGWAIAGGCRPEDLIERWMTLECATKYRWRIPRQIRGGFLDTRAVVAVIDEIYNSFRPKIDYALVITELLTLKPRIVQGPDVTADHLKASAAIFAIFDQVKVGDKTYTDGGLLTALPTWAAVELGADRIIAVNALPTLPGVLLRMLVRTVRTAARFRPIMPPNLETVLIAPSKPLGGPVDALCWTRENAALWIEQGRQDALAQKHSIQNCFERK